jgi:MoxR-like ATPase
MLDERYHISFSDIRDSHLAGLRHRVLLNFEAQAEGVSNDDVLNQIVKEISTTGEKVESK